MKRLWKYIPPCLSDILGFQQVMNQTGGLGIVDDPTKYKALKLGRKQRAASDKSEIREKDNQKKHDSSKQDNSKHDGSKHGGGGSDVRIIVSEIRETDAVVGTADKMMRAFERGNRQFQPEFVLLTTAPCASMISTDLEEIARDIEAKSGIPAGAVKLDGQRDYLYGVSHTLEAMGRLLLERRETIANTVNLLGCNIVDWPESAVHDTEKWLADAGFQVLSRWGAKETTADLREAAAASVNLVVNISGLRLAKYMEQEFGIPYVVGAPFGARQCDRLLRQLKGEPVEERLREAEESPEILVIGEQLQADAIREALLEKGIRAVRVLSFFEMDKQLMQPGDKKLVSEDELIEQIKSGSFRAVIGDQDYQFGEGETLRWIALPNPGNSAPAVPFVPFSMVGESLDRWLDEQLA